MFFDEVFRVPVRLSPMFFYNWKIVGPINVIVSNILVWHGAVGEQLGDLKTLDNIDWVYKLIANVYI